jgi:hypothetical protein
MAVDGSSGEDGQAESGQGDHQCKHRVLGAHRAGTEILQRPIVGESDANDVPKHDKPHLEKPDGRGGGDEEFDPPLGWPSKRMSVK